MHASSWYVPFFLFRNKQFAVVENPGFWNWTFTLKDIEGNVLAEIDRDWRGFGFEVGSSICSLLSDIEAQIGVLR